MGAPPPSWSESVVKLAHKKGDTKDPKNFRMIALTGCIGKCFHLLLAARLTSYLTSNKLIDNTTQKAFLPGINGCIEHNIVMEEIIKDARLKNKTAHITFFDLEDAFGSVSHSLIDETFRRNQLPENIKRYFHNLYTHSKSVVCTNNFKSEPFCFKRGVFQGDPLSPVVFLMVFNPILESLKLDEERFGYLLEEKKIITLPYADDFCVITTHKRTHQNLINTIHSHTQSMGMKLKPSKCRSFSISSGKPTDVPFFIGNDRVPSIRDEEQKFLGKLLFFSGKSEETFNLIKDTFKEAMDNIENSSVRNEYKLWIYSSYLLPSKRFLLTVHTLTDTQLRKLDVFTDKYIKKWAGLPPSATNAVIHMREGLNFKSISELYMETHTISHARTRLEGDSNVNYVLNCTVTRESNYTRKKGTTAEAEVEYQRAVNMNTVQGEIPNFEYEEGDKDKRKFNLEIKNQIKSSLQVKNQEKWIEHVKTLTQQGNFLALAAAEYEDVIWKSYMFNLKQGTMKFLLNSAIDTLPTAANLFKWKKITSDKCKLCRCVQTTSHILNICKVSLDNGKFLWRHNNVINYVLNCVDTAKYTVYADLPGHTVGGGTIPAEICITTQKPDIVIIDEKQKIINLFELTVPLPRNIEVRHTEKSDRYAHFVTDCTGYKCNVTAFEIGSCGGYISTRNHSALYSLHKFTKPGIKLSKFDKNISALAVYSSYHIFITRNEDIFREPPFLLPPFSDQ